MRLIFPVFSRNNSSKTLVRVKRTPGRFPKVNEFLPTHLRESGDSDVPRWPPSDLNSVYLGPLFGL